MSASCRCGATWGGHKAEHCTACHQTFTGTTAGDAHRVGPHDGDRRCLTVAEMHASKKVHLTKRGQWASGAEARVFS